MKKNRHCCRRCHFLTKNTSAYGTQPWDKEDRVFCWPEGNRDKIYLSGIPEENRSAFKVYQVGCREKEWESVYDEFANGPSRQSLKEKILRSREGQCFFVKYRPGISFPDALELQRRSNELQAKRDADRRYKNNCIVSAITLFFVIISIIVSIIIGFDDVQTFFKQILGE